MKLSQNLKLAIEASIKAGKKILEIYTSDDFNLDYKDDNSPLTLADIASNEIIENILKTSNIPILSEEGNILDYQQRKDFKQLWIVDPLDGTKEFIHRRGDFTVNIAYVEDGLPTMGVVYAPEKKRLFITDAVGVSFEELGDHNVDIVGEMKRISVSIPDEDALIVVASKSHLTDETKDYIGKYNVKDRRSAGSSLKFCLVATGEADIYPRFGRTMEWDTAAGQAILEGAGGCVVKFDNYERLTYGKPAFENPHFIAYAPGIQLQKA